LTLFDAIPNPNNLNGKIYGAFPHLGKGKVTFPAGKMKVGYTALLRLLFLDNASSHRVVLPSRISGKRFPMSFGVPVREELVKSLNDLLAGRSPRLLTLLNERLRANQHILDYMRGGLESDVAAARDFYALGPKALRLFKQRHRLPPGPVDQRTFDEHLKRELRELVGDFRL
ncbi:MAG: hypothetical protein ACRD1T_22770, partial [Acidimicrobiia bacterium]